MPTKTELLAVLAELAASSGPDITLFKFREATGFSRHMVYDRWGNWTNLRLAAGLPPRCRPRPVYSDDVLFEELSRTGEACNQFPTTLAFDRLSDRCWQTLSRRFGSKETIWDRYREWLEPRPNESRPKYLHDCPPDYDPCHVPGVFLFNNRTQFQQLGKTEQAGLFDDPNLLGLLSVPVVRRSVSKALRLSLGLTQRPPAATPPAANPPATETSDADSATSPADGPSSPSVLKLLLLLCAATLLPLTELFKHKEVSRANATSDAAILWEQPPLVETPVSAGERDGDGTSTRSATLRKNTSSVWRRCSRESGPFQLRGRVLAKSQNLADFHPRPAVIPGLAEGVRTVVSPAEQIRRARTGDEAALGDLLAEHRNQLRRMAEHALPPRLKARVDASDIVQQTCLSVFRQIADFQGHEPAQFAAWLRQMHERNIQNAIRDQLHTAKRGDGRTAPLDDGPGPEPTPSRHAIRREELARLGTELDRLPPDEAHVLRLRYLEGRTLAQISTDLDLTKDAVVWLMQKALQRLRRGLPDDAPD